MDVIELTGGNVQQTIDENEILLVDFWGEGCQPCKMFKPIFEKAAEANPDIAFATCNTTANQDVAMAFGIQSVPTLAVFRDKMLLFMQPGALPGPVLDELIGKVKELDMEQVRAEAAEQQAAQAAGEEGAGPEAEPAAPAAEVPPAEEEAPPPVIVEPADADDDDDEEDGAGIARLADDPVLRRQGVTREFLDAVKEGALSDSALEISRDVLLMYEGLREGLREAEDDEARDEVRARLDKWDLPARTLESLEAETRSELKAVMRAIDELVRK